MALSTPFKGPHKARRLPLAVAVSRQGFRIFDPRVQQLFDTADISSEGARKSPQGAPEGQNEYFGTTNIVLLPSLLDTSGLGLEPHMLLRLFAWDPHVRLRALRIACREAQVRANGPLDRVRTEIVVTQAAPGICVHVDLEARVLSEPQSLGASAKQFVGVGSKRARRVV